MKETKIIESEIRRAKSHLANFFFKEKDIGGNFIKHVQISFCP